MRATWNATPDWPSPNSNRERGSGRGARERHGLVSLEASPAVAVVGDDRGRHRHRRIRGLGQNHESVAGGNARTLAGAAAIIAGSGTLALLILARINQRIVPVAVTLADVREITLTCHRCRARQTVAIGSGKCGACGLVIQVRVQEPEPEEQKIGA